MCRFISFIQNSSTGEVKVHNLNSHSDTFAHFNLRDDQTKGGIWREGHYLPNGTLECRALDGDDLTASQMENFIRASWPDFVSFANWCLQRVDLSGGWLDFRGLTNAEGLVLSQSIGGWLELQAGVWAQIERTGNKWAAIGG